MARNSKARLHKAQQKAISHRVKRAVKRLACSKKVQQGSATVVAAEKAARREARVQAEKWVSCQAEWAAKSLTALRSEAKSFDLAGRSKMNKEELAAACAALAFNR